MFRSYVQATPEGRPWWQRRARREWATREDAAAAKVQELWRRYANRRIYRYYRDLIQFRLTGDPGAWIDVFFLRGFMAG